MFEKCYHLKFFTSFFACLKLHTLKLKYSRSVWTCTDTHSLSSGFLPWYHSEALRDVALRRSPEEWNSSYNVVEPSPHANRIFLHLTLNWNGLSPLRSDHPCLLVTRRIGVLALLVTSWYLLAKRSTSDPRLPWNPYFHFCGHNGSPLSFIPSTSSASHHIFKAAF